MWFPYSTYNIFSCPVVSSYTREAGVRQLERRVGSICRAVAVKVLESRNRNDQQKTVGVKESEKIQEKEEDSRVDQSAIVHPPEMPIVIDEAAVEDILGVSL